MKKPLKIFKASKTELFLSAENPSMTSDPTDRGQHEQLEIHENKKAPIPGQKTGSWILNPMKCFVSA